MGGSTFTHGCLSELQTNKVKTGGGSLTAQRHGQAICTFQVRLREACALDLLCDIRLDAQVVLHHARVVVDGRQEELVPERKAALLVVQQAHLQSDHLLVSDAYCVTNAHGGAPEVPQKKKTITSFIKFLSLDAMAHCITEAPMCVDGSTVMKWFPYNVHK